MRFAAFLIIASMMPSVVMAETITVSAAISMRESLEEIGKAFEARSGNAVKFNFDSSGKLAQQIMQGAPVDAFVSADNEQMDMLIKAGDAIPSSHCVVARNTLVLIVPANQPHAVSGFADLVHAHGKIAIGDPRSVPAGHYARQVLSDLKIEDAVKDRLVLGENVRQVLTYVERGEVDAGIVYGTDAKQAGNAVKVVATADIGWHDRIEYPAVVVSGCAHATVAGQFLDFLRAEPARAILARHGFEMPDDKSSAKPTSQP
jgi:molybdate transport system substrate-binding protein